jgi:hypothetical protein
LPDHYRLSVAAIVSCLACSPAIAGDNSPLGRLTAKPGESVCFGRTYDAAHLRQHPAQATTSVVLSYRNEDETGHPNVRIMMRRKSRPAPLYIVASCSWNTGFNRDVQDRPIFKRIRSRTGFDCIPHTEKDSEEGGYFIIETGADAKSLLLHLDEYEAAWPDTDLGKEPDSAKFGAEDRVFRLDRTSGDACRAIEKDLIVKWLREEAK